MLAQGCQSCAYIYNLLLCQKQRHEEKITIWSWIISPWDKGMEAILSGMGEMALCLGTVQHFKPPKQLHYYRRFLSMSCSSLWITSVSNHHLWQQTGDNKTYPWWTHGNDNLPCGFSKKKRKKGGKNLHLLTMKLDHINYQLHVMVEEKLN